MGSMMRFMGAEWCEDEIPEEKKLAKLAALDTNFQQENACIAYEAWPDPGEEVDMIGSYMASAVFAFAVLSTIPSLRSQMAEPARMPSAVTRSLGIVFTAYASVMTVGYFGFGEGVAPDLASKLATDFPLIGRITSTAILGNCILS